mgnify:CR=1 FL=1
MKIALDNIDAVIETIKKSKDKDEANKNLQTKFKLTEIQATAILEMQLQKLSGLERKKIEDELAEKMLLIEDLEDILARQNEWTLSSSKSSMRSKINLVMSEKLKCTPELSESSIQKTPSQMRI